MQFDSFTGDEWYDGEHVVRMQSIFLPQGSPCFVVDAVPYIPYDNEDLYLPDEGSGMLNWPLDIELVVPAEFGEEGTLSVWEMLDWDFSNYLIEVTTENNTIVAATVLQYAEN